MSVVPELPRHFPGYEPDGQEDQENDVVEPSINLLRDQTRFPHDFETEDVTLRRVGEDAIAMKLTKIGQSVVILGIWENEEFVEGRHIIRRNDVLVHRRDFDHEDTDPELIRDLGLVSAALDRAAGQRLTRTYGTDIAARQRSAPLAGNHGTDSQIVMERSRSKEQPVFSPEDKRVAESIKRGPVTHGPTPSEASRDDGTPSW